ncbi:MAG: glycosyltransferase [bacterium]
MQIDIYFLGNAFKDSRITNLANSLKLDGYKVNVISFDWYTENFVEIIGDISVYKLSKKSSLIFYMHFAYITLKRLFLSKSDLFFAEDVYTLPFVTFIAKLKRKVIFYNSREFYAFLGGLTGRKVLQRVITSIERFFIKKTNLVLTTGDMDSEFLENFYNIKNTCVIRNIPLKKQNFEKHDFRKELGISENQIILLYQGVLLKGRGTKLILKALAKLKDCVLIILGDGVLKKELMDLAENLNITDRVFFYGTIENKYLDKFTAGADIGFSLIENISISYYYALPNKLFEYINAQVPIISSNLPQMKKIIEEYNVGKVIEIEGISEEEKINNIVQNVENLISMPQELRKYKINCLSASNILNWEEEYNRAKPKLFNYLNKLN